MLYANTENGKLEKLEELKLAVAGFITKLESINVKPMESEELQLLDEINKLGGGLSRAWGKQEKIAEEITKKLETAYRSFWDKIDKMESK